MLKLDVGVFLCHLVSEKRSTFVVRTYSRNLNFRDTASLPLHRRPCEQQEVLLRVSNQISVTSLAALCHVCQHTPAGGPLSSAFLTAMSSSTSSTATALLLQLNCCPSDCLFATAPADLSTDLMTDCLLITVCLFTCFCLSAYLSVCLYLCLRLLISSCLCLSVSTSVSASVALLVVPAPATEALTSPATASDTM